MSIKYPINPSLGASVKAFPKTQYAKIVEIIDAINGLAKLVATASVTITPASGTISGTTATVNSAAGTLTTPALTTIGGATSAAYTITNSFAKTTSTIILTPVYAAGKTGNPIAILESFTTGSFVVKVGNGAPAATALNDVVKINFVIL